MNTSAQQPAVRVHESVLARSEKQALVWLARHMPAWVNSDHLTLLGLVAMLVAGFAYWRAGIVPAWLHVVNVALVLNWFGDSLDGTLARVRDRQRPRYGFYIDHVVDALSAVFLLGGLALSSLMTAWIAVALLLVYLLLSIESYLATHVLGKFHVSHFGFGPTELRITLIVGNLFLLRRPWVNLLGDRYLLFDVGGIIATAGMAIVFIIVTARHTAALYREETR